MIKNMLHGVLFYGVLFALLVNSGVGFWYGAAIYSWVFVLDLTSYCVGLKKGIEL